MPSIEQTREKAREMLPAHMVRGMLDYIERGYTPGGFLSALLSNDLRRTFEQADSVNQHAVRAYMQFLYNYAPAGCWGSVERFDRWLEHKGLEGREEFYANQKEDAE